MPVYTFQNAVRHLLRHGLMARRLGWVEGVFCYMDACDRVVSVWATQSGTPAGVCQNELTAGDYLGDDWVEFTPEDLGRYTYPPPPAVPRGTILAPRDRAATPVRDGVFTSPLLEAKKASHP